MSGAISSHYGWQSFFWLETGLSAFAIFLIAFTFPETKYHRSHALTQQYSPSSISKERTTMEAVDIEGTSSSQSSAAEPIAPSTYSLAMGKGRPSLSQFAPFQRADSRWKMFIVRDTWTPIKVFFSPIIFWAGLMLAGPADLVLFFNITESVILHAPPYNFSSDKVGYSNFAFVVGALIGLATAGPFSDWVAARATRRNNGIREAEMRLPALLPYMLITMLSLILGGVAYQHQWAWPHIIVWGYALGGLSVCSVPTIAIAYAIDCYKPISGEIMVVATVCKNFIAFSYAYWIFDLAHQLPTGWVAPAMVIFACTVGPALFAIPLYYGLGKKIRRWTRKSDVHRMEDMI
jgi:hypothetical protein